MRRREFLGATLSVGAAGVIAPSSFAMPCPPIIDGSTFQSCGLSSNAPQWAYDLTPFEWTSLNNTNNFRDVVAPNIGQYGNTGPNSVMIAWCGAVFANQFGESGSMIHWGGGHQDYYGNEVYSFDLSTLTWSRLSEPSPHGTGGTIPNGVYPDGTPGATHTYYFVNYRPRDNSFVTARRETTNLGGYGLTKISQFHLGSNTWTNSDAATSIAAHSGEGSVYDSKRDVVWTITGLSGLGWAKYSFEDDQWTSYSEPSGAYELRGLAYIDSHDCVIFRAASGEIIGLDPLEPTTKTTLSVVGQAPIIDIGSMFEWSTGLGAVVAYQRHSNNLRKLVPPSSSNWKSDDWQWEPIVTTGEAGPHSANGPYGKFRIAEWGALTIGLLNDDPGGPCKAIRLSA